MSLNQTAERIDRKKTTFKRLVIQWEKVTNGLYETRDVFNTINDEEAENDNWLQGLREVYENKYFEQLRILFETDEKCTELYNDDWFWAEWTATDNCFYFVYGLTAANREEFLVNKHNRMIDAQEEEAKKND